MRSRRDLRRAAFGSRLLARVEEVLRIERTLDRTVQLEGAGPELPLEPVALDEPDPVLAGDRSAEAQRQFEQGVGELWRERELSLVVGREEEGRVQVAIAGVAPRACRHTQPFPDLERLLNCLAEPVERHGDVLTCLPTALRVHDERKAVAPLPERTDLLRRLRRIEGLRILCKDLEQ